MKKTLIYPLIFVGFWGVACGGDGARRGNQTAAYETVQEGSAAGVTSTIQGPGEALPPITGTNADTTTAFSIDPNVASAAAPAPTPGSGTLAGTLPSQPAYPQPMTSASEPRPAYVPRQPQQQQPQQTQQRSYPVQQPQPQQRPLEQERPEPQQPPATDTAATTPPQQPQQQQPPPAAEKQQQPPATNTNPPADEGEDEEPAEEPPPPPPTTTDTRGQ